jgi:hypothetical protein
MGSIDMRFWPVLLVVALIIPLQTNPLPVVGDNMLLGYVGDCCGQDQSIAVDPTSSNRIVAAAGSYYWYSVDRGLTWSSGSLFDLGIGAGDPSLAFDSMSNVYLGSVVDTEHDTSMAVLKSTDGGRSWNLVRLTGRTDATKWLNDKQWVAVDTSQSHFHDRIYVVWDVFVNGTWNQAHNNIVGASFGGVYLSYSNDHGVSYSKPAKLSIEMYALQMAIGRAGEVYLVGSMPYRGLNFIESTDGGEHFTYPVQISRLCCEFPNPLPNTKVRTNLYPFPSLGLDRTNGNIYVAWTDPRYGDGDIFVSHSTDGGASWSLAVRVNDDPQSDHKDQLMPSVAVSSDGVVHVAFVDRRDDPSNTAYNIYYADSADYGNSFGRNLKVSTASSNPNMLHDPTFIGDYLGIAAGNDGTVHVAWGGVGSNSQYASSRVTNGLAIFESTISYKLANSTKTTTIPTQTETSSSTQVASSTTHAFTSSSSMTEGVSPAEGSFSQYIIALSSIAIVLVVSIIIVRRRLRAKSH